MWNGKTSLGHTHLVVLDAAAALTPIGLGEVDPEVGLCAAPAHHRAAGLRPVGAVDDALEGLLRVDPDGHGAPNARRLHRRLKPVAEPLLGDGL